MTKSPGSCQGPITPHATLWALVRPTVRAVETDDGVLIFDDTILDRLVHNAHRIPLKGKSMRKNHPLALADNDGTAVTGG